MLPAPALEAVPVVPPHQPQVQAVRGGLQLVKGSLPLAVRYRTSMVSDSGFGDISFIV